MKLNSLVRINIGRKRRHAYGVLTEIDLKNQRGVVMRNGKRYVRDLKRICGSFSVLSTDAGLGE